MLELHFRNNGSSTARFKFRLFRRAGLGECPPNEAVAGDQFSTISADYTLRPEQGRRPWGFLTKEQAQSQWTVCFYDVEDE